MVMERKNMRPLRKVFIGWNVFWLIVLTLSLIVPAFFGTVYKGHAGTAHTLPMNAAVMGTVLMTLMLDVKFFIVYWVFKGLFWLFRPAMPKKEVVS
jgi:hypothetical protein